ncbi:MAG: hypothetical protein RhofKO_07080 [Rhodothermales bacterium]
MPYQYTIVKWFDAKKGYGFLEHPEGGADIFIHYSNIVSDERYKTLRTGQEVRFEIYDGPKGVHAHNVEGLHDEEDEDEEGYYYVDSNGVMNTAH